MHYTLPIEYQITEWAWHRGVSVASLSPSIPDLRGKPVIFALKTINDEKQNIIVDVASPVGDPSVLLLESPIDDDVSIKTISKLSDAQRKKLSQTLITEYLRVQGLYYDLQSNPMYIHTVVPLKNITEKDFGDELTKVTRAAILTRLLIIQAGE